MKSILFCGFPFFFFAGFSLLTACPPKDEVNSKRVNHNPDNIRRAVPQFPLMELLAKKGYDENETIGFLIDKSDYTLTVFVKGEEIKKYPVVFGGNPIDDKLKEGDKCTPEGTFGVRSKYLHKKWNKFIWIDYPNAASWQKHNTAKKNQQITSSATIGGEIGIHGVPAGKDYLIDMKYNWTLGCISLKNHHVNEIFDVLNTQNAQVRIVK